MTHLDSLLRSDPLPPSRHRRTWGRRIAALLALAAVVAATVGAVLLLRGPDETVDFAGSGQGTAVVVVPIAEGDTGGYKAGRDLDKKQREELMKLYGFDKPAHVRYFEMLGNFLRFDLGKSSVKRNQGACKLKGSS